MTRSNPSSSRVRSSGVLNVLSVAAVSSLAAVIAFGAAVSGRDDPSSDRGVLLARAKSFLERNAEIKSGESVLLISDSSIDEFVRAAFFQAAGQVGGRVTELMLQARTDVTDGYEIAQQMRFRPWFPEWVWKTAAENQVVLELTNLGSGHVGGHPKLPNTRVVDLPFSRREQLADPMARGNYPEPLVEAIARVVWKQVVGGTRFTLRDTEGTDLQWTLDETAWSELKDFDPASKSDHLSLPGPYRTQSPDMRGWLAGSSTHSGPFPKIRLKVEQGRVTEIHDGGHVADSLRQLFAASKDLTFPGFPAAGSNWVEETTIGTRPRHARVPGAEKLGWSAEMSAWNGAARAGVFHLAVGTSRSGRNYPFAKEHGLAPQHFDIELYEPTLTIDGRAVITKGRLAALEDPQLKQEAAKFGNAADLLRVTWLPRVTGR